eukprot:Seg6251.1 transcript_id=Seg6251.1/GoldUCD/mRNA.D3Y31 product="Protein C9orf135" protein_id=Seg6251.1/GoldUCD/D3Y31
MLERLFRRHQVREADPKDYDLHDYEPEKRSLHRSTHHRLANVTNGELPNSTTRDHMAQRITLKADYEEQTTRQPMVDMSTFTKIKIETDGPPGKVLPRHPKDYNKRYLDTTYYTDYKYPYQYKPYVQPPDKDNSAAYKKCHSQFTDTADYRRSGLNTWQDESGHYANTEAKRTVFPKTDTIRDFCN